MKAFIKLMIVPILFVTISASQAVVITPTTYDLDNNIGEALLGNSGDATELQALADILGVGVDTLTIDQKHDSSDSNIMQNLGTTDEWVIDVAPNEPGWWLVKFGIGGISATADTFYFDNLLSTDATKLVFSDAQVQGITGAVGCNNCNIGRLSHYTSFISINDVGPPVPIPTPVTEPGIMALFGMGLLGIGLSNLRRKRKVS